MRFLSAVCLVSVACAPATTPSDPAPVSSTSQLLPAAVELERSAGLESLGPVTSAEAVWTVDNDWDAVSPEAGLAWSANSGLTWEEKYRTWIDALQSTASVDGNLTTELTTPWGRVLPLNRLECAETAIMLRATFASWHHLPFFLKGYSPTLGQNVYYGHFGMVTAGGTPVSWAPEFSGWTDYTAAYAGLSDAEVLATWPDDPELEARALTLQQDDHNDFLGPDAYSGAYFDELFLDKRVGHFLMHALTDFGSIHLAHDTNLFDLEAEAVEPGDVLIHRWQPQGTGHTMVVKEVDGDVAGFLEIDLLAGNMPRVQPRWMGSGMSHMYFTHRNAGSAQTNSDGDAYVSFGGGLKRWRAAIQDGGRWVNTVPMADRPDWVDPTDTTALTDRIDDFDQLLGAPTPEGERDALLLVIEMSRDALRSHPSSCANRERREAAFDSLYALMELHWGWTRQETDTAYRELDDYVFAELEYSASPSCCWNSTTPEMYDIILDHAEQELADAEASGSCVEPTTFQMRDGGYDPFVSYAVATGRGADWVEWSADETCPQAGATDGVVISAPFTDWCALGADDDDPMCVPDAEVCDGVDNDCDGVVDEGCDDDGNPSTGSGTDDCGCGSSSSMWWTMMGGLAMVGSRRRSFLGR